MPRRREVAKRVILPDPKFNDRVVAKLVSVIMLDGKKSTAERALYGALDIVSQKAGEEPVKVLKKCLDNIKPMLEVKSRRVGGSTYQVPVEVRADRRVSLAMRWLVRYANERSEKTITDKLAGEILDAYNNRGAAVKKREDTHRMAEANRAFAHYRW
ncbi:30S ribosomal protein S7 [Geobacter sulfurreducens]|jgi:small subunit ribosomal protein S7|uniref:30S ribosomal protein S7 n=1 Tax=Geobacter TaxID=28231 RepID=UPI0001D8F5B6|nr:30S ribosomal protein S7 [Geobacter sulfurreducens]BET59247.1 30S ribosomal protein S7 [Geobacter sp. 60473]ADI85615.1 ribosomal protein S7 [Geobacter sulfurreducens KN400]AJY69129.1 30S ribosomal protein S7 [Geobacter sulfurreducens]QVW34677.1 30S ribosomal protein S7 [Geobacter sulfurreducens]UTG92183.1 30S ribosomal protein S7 [Geobacter sulfurreducens]